VIDTVETITSFTQSNLIGQIKQAFTALPYARSGNGVYQKYAMSDAALSAFSVFFMQSPSFSCLICLIIFDCVKLVIVSTVSITGWFF
jgi:hypothetical protein